MICIVDFFCVVFHREANGNNVLEEKYYLHAHIICPLYNLHVLGKSANFTYGKITEVELKVLCRLHSKRAQHNIDFVNTFVTIRGKLQDKKLAAQEYQTM